MLTKLNDWFWKSLDDAMIIGFAAAAAIGLASFTPFSTVAELGIGGVTGYLVAAAYNRARQK